MPHLSLKLRLSLALLAIVSLLGVVVLTSYLTHRDLQAEVAVLCARQQVDLREVDLGRNGVVLEGTWDPAGVFIAREVEVLPGRRRPSLRGTIQSVDLRRSMFTLYGQSITVGDELVEDYRSQLAAGRRVEVTCDVNGGAWRARKLAFDGIKDSDKIKACATSWELDGVAPESLNIHGITVSLAPRPELGVDNALHHIETATALLLCLRELRTQAITLAEAPLASAPAFELQAAREDFENYLTRARPVEDPGSGETPPNQWVARIFDQLPELDQKLGNLVSAVGRSQEDGRAELKSGLGLFLDSDLEPRLNSYLRAAQDDLGDRARAIETRTAQSARLGLFIGIIATLVALLLGILLWRSIKQPLAALEVAAKKIGDGDLTARVSITSHDELGTLAASFNHMTETLALTTVSIENLQNILDSMGGSLILLTPELRVKGINRAAAQLLLFEPEELVGSPLSLLCGESSETELISQSDVNQPVTERSLRSKDGKLLAVSFSASELRSADGTHGGYVCVAHDLSEQKQVESQVRSSLEEKELLLREVHHRVKNNMQVISSLLAMQQSCTENPIVVEGLEQSQARIRSMALIHEHLYQSADLAEADVSAYLHLLISHISHSLGGGDLIELDLHIDSIDLGLDQSLALGLIVNELLANSFRHAFESDGRGRIQLSLRTVGGDQAELLVKDDGRGMDLRTSGHNRGSLGLNLVSTLVDQLGGTTHVTVNGGVTTCITFPCNRHERVAS